MPKQDTRDIKSFEAEDDVGRMLRNAKKAGIKLKFLCNQALRKYLPEQGYGSPKDEQE